MKKIVFILFLVTFISTTFGQFTTVWERNSRTGAADVKPSWFGAGTERGIAYGDMGSGPRLYVLSRNGGNFVKTINPSTGADIDPQPGFTFNTTGQSSQLLALNDIEMTSDNVLIAASVSSNSAGTEWYIHVATSEGGAFTRYTMTLDATTERVGDKITVLGSWSAGTVEIWTSTGALSTGKIYVFKTTNQGTDWTKTSFSLSGTYTSTVGNSAVAPLALSGDFYLTGNGGQLRKHNSSGAYVSNSLMTNTSSSKCGTKHFSIGGRDYLVSYGYRADPGTTGDQIGRIYIYNVTTPTSTSTYGVTPLQGSVAGGNSINGDATFRNNGDGTFTVYVLATDQGIGAYTTNTGSIGWANLQSPSTASITTVGSVNVYGQVWVDGVTNASGQGAGISAWLGYSTTNSNPNTWTNWIQATYNTDASNNDEYVAALSGLSVGTYYYAYRYQNQLGTYYYGGYSGGGGGAWDGTTNVSGQLTVTEPPTTIDWCNLQHPASGSTTTTGNFDVYAQVFIDGVTNPAGQASGISSWIGYSTTDSDPSTWTNWVSASYHADAGNNDEYKGTLSSLAAGTYYYASRFQRNGGAYYYGGYKEGGGGFWDGTDYVSGTLTVTEAATIIDWCNLQHPATGSISPLGSFDVYGQIFVDGVTNPSGQAANISCWIGYSTDNTNPNTWTNWVAASYTGDVGNNDEYKGTITGLTSGTYYYATRFQRNGGSYYYGGYQEGSGGFWNGTTNVAGTLTVTGLSGTYYIGTAGTKPGGGDPDFLSLKSACDAVNVNSVAGNITFLFTSDLTEPVNVGLGKDPGANTITFKPYTGLTPTINFTQSADNAGASGAWVIGVPDLTVTSGTNYGLVTTRNVIIDGSNTNDGTTRDLSVTTQSGISGNTYTIRIFGDADYVTIKNTNVTANQSTSYAVLLTSRNFSSTNYLPDNVTIENCNITNIVSITGQALAISNSGTPTAYPSGIVFKNNNITARTRGIFLNYAGNTDIIGNTISVNQTTTGYMSYGIWGYVIGTGSITNIYNNKITQLATANSSSGDYGIVGIACGSNGTYNVYNNFIAGFNPTSGTANPSFVMEGIRVNNANATANIYYNSIYLPNASVNLGTGTARYTGIYISNGTNTVKNNIIQTDENDFVSYCIYRAGTNGTITSNYNNFFRNGTVNQIGFWNDAATSDLDAWKTASSGDANSISANPLFHTTTNLHVLPNSPVANAGTPIPGITTDIDGDTRHETTPCIGADEFVPVASTTSGTASNPDGSTDNPVVPTSGAGGVTFNPSTGLTGNVNGSYYGSGRSGSAPSGVANIAPYFWSLSTNITGFTASVRFYFNQILGNGVNNYETIKLLRRSHSGAAWEEYADVTRHAEYIQANGLTGFSEFTLGGGEDNPLPVELNALKTTVKHSTVTLNWNTQTEINTYLFEIEKNIVASEQIQWLKVGEVSASGNSNSPKEYSFTDKNLAPGKYAYRLKMIDNDGTFEYSDIVEAEVIAPTEFALYQNYPNPFNPVTTINYSIPVDASVQLYIFTITGELVQTLVNEQQAAGSYSVNFDARQFASGTYIYRLVANDFVQTKKMVLLK